MPAEARQVTQCGFTKRSELWTLENWETWGQRQKPHSSHYTLKCLGSIKNIMDFIGVSNRISHIHGIMYSTECNRCAPKKSLHSWAMIQVLICFSIYNTHRCSYMCIMTKKGGEGCSSQHLKNFQVNLYGGTWVAQSLKHLTQFRLRSYLTVREIESQVRLYADSGVCLGFSLSICLCLSSACVRTCALSQNKYT